MTDPVIFQEAAPWKLLRLHSVKTRQFMTTDLFHSKLGKIKCLYRTNSAHRKLKLLQHYQANIIFSLTEFEQKSVVQEEHTNAKVSPPPPPLFCVWRVSLLKLNHMWTAVFLMNLQTQAVIMRAERAAFMPHDEVRGQWSPPQRESVDLYQGSSWKTTVSWQRSCFLPVSSVCLMWGWSLS